MSLKAPKPTQTPKNQTAKVAEKGAMQPPSLTVNVGALERPAGASTSMSPGMQEALAVTPPNFIEDFNPEDTPGAKPGRGGATIYQGWAYFWRSPSERYGIAEGGWVRTRPAADEDPVTALPAIGVDTKEARPPSFSREELLALWFENEPGAHSPYQIHGCPPMWRTSEQDGMVLFTCPMKTMTKIQPNEPYTEVDGITYQFQRDGKWIGQACNTTFEEFEKNGAEYIP